MDIKTFYVEFPPTPPATGSPRGTLVSHAELDGDLSSVVGERVDLATDVFDLQATLGFRGPAGRVAIESAAVPTSDNWAFNDVRGDAGFDYDDLSMVGVALLVGIKEQRALASTSSVVWGEPRSIPRGIRVGGASGRAGLRALAPLPPPPASSPEPSEPPPTAETGP